MPFLYQLRYYANWILQINIDRYYGITGSSLKPGKSAGSLPKLRVKVIVRTRGSEIARALIIDSVASLLPSLMKTISMTYLESAFDSRTLV